MMFCMTEELAMVVVENFISRCLHLKLYAVLESFTFGSLGIPVVEIGTCITILYNKFSVLCVFLNYYCVSHIRYLY